MAEPITLEFELNADQVTQALSVRADRRGSLYWAATMLVGAATCYALYLDDRPRMWIPAGLFLAYGLAMLFHAAFYLPRKARADVARLSGEVRVKFAEDGVRYAAKNTAKGYSWPKIKAFVDKPDAWVLRAGKKNETYVIPKAAVAQDDAEQCATQLKDWAGKAYRSTKR